MDTETTDYVCEACEKRFETEAELERHVRNVGIVD